MYLETHQNYTSAEIGIEYPAFEQVGQPDEQEPSGIKLARELHRALCAMDIKIMSLISTTSNFDEFMRIQREIRPLMRKAQDDIWKLNGASWNDGFQVGLQRPDNDLPF
jgi:hypothetical protein